MFFLIKHIYSLIFKGSMPSREYQTQYATPLLLCSQTLFFTPKLFSLFWQFSTSKTVVGSEILANRILIWSANSSPVSKRKMRMAVWLCGWLIDWHRERERERERERATTHLHDWDPEAYSRFVQSMSHSEAYL